MNLHAESRGAGEDLVLIHGWGMNAAAWSTVAERLAARYRVTTVELPGHGASEYDAGHAQFDDWVRACLDVTPQRAVWVGWSLGGQIAQRAAVLSPERVRKLVAVASTPRFVRGADWPMAMDEQTLRAFSEALQRNPSQTLERFLSLQVKGDDEARQALRLLRLELAARPAGKPAALARGLDFLLSVDLRDQLASIESPVLWLLGERDTLVPAGVGEAVAALAPAAKIRVLPGCAHAPFLSHPDRSLELMQEFVDDDSF